MATSNQPGPEDTLPEDTLEQLLDRVSNARDELDALERTLERLRADIFKTKQKNSPGKLR